MSIASEIFENREPVAEALEKFGFVRDGDGFFYRELFMDELAAEIRISGDELVECRAVDTETGEEYALINVEAQVGAYVGTARELYRGVLQRVADSCFTGTNSGETERGRKYWIIPSNPKYFDVEGGFRESGCDTLAWHQRIRVMPGDIVYIYQAEPVASIRFRCEVSKASVPRGNYHGMSPRSTEIMYLRRTDTFAPGVYTRAWMNAHGIAKTIRGQRSAPDELVEAIEMDI